MDVKCRASSRQRSREAKLCGMISPPRQEVRPTLTSEFELEKGIAVCKKLDICPLYETFSVSVFVPITPQIAFCLSKT
jgi:hypothetical protein